MCRVLLVLAFCLAASAVRGEGPRGDSRDVLLLLEDGPLHLRFHVTLRGRPLSERREEYMTRLMERLDVDGDGKLSKAERDRSPLFSYGRKRFDNEFLRSLESSKMYTRGEVERDLARFGELFSYRQDDSASENDDRVFEVLDADGSGRIEPHEMRLAASRIAELDRDRDQCVSFEEFSATAALGRERPVAAGPQREDDFEPPKSYLSKVMRDTHNLTLSRDLMRKYDRNRDGLLTPEELGWNEERFRVLDANGDGKLSLRELRDFERLPVDLELTVDLKGSDDGGEIPMQVIQSAADREAAAPRPDLVKVVFGRTTVTFSYRSLDPVQAALENARLRFNLLDVDGNGYLDRDEVAGDSRFERLLFDAMDADGDGMLFAEEMEEYVVAVCEPAATTCHVNVYDTGAGYFQMLDTNGDGRISIRELREVEANLTAYEKEPGMGIGPEEMGQHYFVEFVRGSFQVFGSTERLIALGPTFIEREPVGPSWFRALDRNRDGDLTYLSDDPRYPPEFIFHPEEAAAMDLDGDGLISVEEAEAYERRLLRGGRESPEKKQTTSPRRAAQGADAPRSGTIEHRM